MFDGASSTNNMRARMVPELLKSDLIIPWAIVGIMLIMLAIYLIICHSFGNQLQHPLPEDQRVLLRTVLYVIAIVTFPVTNLIRHIQLRLNQTMPLTRARTLKTDMPAEIDESVATAKNRYLITTLMSMSLIEAIGIFGFIMFVLGDNFNTLYIFIGMSALGVFLYRPKQGEYDSIIEALVRAKR